ncbi:MAG TPA: SpoIIE family protein phosphatase [Bacteroidales bacterium]|nr:SpoIIE family protein phosphatase [Bacteroidales bacterium]
MKLRNTLLNLSIRFKVYFVIGTILVLFSTGFILYHNLINKQARINTKIQNEELYKSVHAIFESQGEFIDRVSTDYSCYDWMYHFVKDPDTSAVDNFVSPPEILDLDFFQVFNLQKKNILERSTLQCSCSKGELNYDSDFFARLYGSRRLQFFSLHEGKLYQVVATTIHPSIDINKRVPPAGYLVIGKLIDSLQLSKIEKLLTCRMQIIDSVQLAKTNTAKGIVLPLYSFNQRKMGGIYVSKLTTYNDIVRPLNAYIDRLVIITFILIAFIIIYAYNRTVLKPLLIIKRALDTNSEKEARKLMFKHDEYGKIARLIVRFFIQRESFTRKIDELLKTKEDLKFLNKELQTQKEELQASANNLELANESIQSQKKLVTDNIYYASIVQQAALIPSIDIGSIFQEHFILFKPRDVISGDFYWFKKLYGKYYVAVADCTGHGLSGALMSMLGVSFLNQIVTLPGSEEFTAAEILQQLREFTVQSLHQQGTTVEVHDGMDIALCIFDFDKMTLEYAAAYAPLYILRPGREGAYKLTSFRGDPIPVGKSYSSAEFTNYILELHKNDIIYLSSDGYVDQFGGPNDRKFLAKNFKELLTSIAHYPLEEQKSILDFTFEGWKGANFQVDDVTVVGLKI